MPSATVARSRGSRRRPRPRRTDRHRRLLLVPWYRVRGECMMDAGTAAPAAGPHTAGPHTGRIPSFGAGPRPRRVLARGTDVAGSDFSAAAATFYRFRRVRCRSFSHKWKRRALRGHIVTYTPYVNERTTIGVIISYICIVPLIVLPRAIAIDVTFSATFGISAISSAQFRPGARVPLAVSPPPPPRHDRRRQYALCRKYANTRCQKKKKKTRARVLLVYSGDRGKLHTVSIQFSRSTLLQRPSLHSEKGFQLLISRVRFVLLHVQHIILYTNECSWKKAKAVMVFWKKFFKIFRKTLRRINMHTSYPVLMVTMGRKFIKRWLEEGSRKLGTHLHWERESIEMVRCAAAGTKRGYKTISNWRQPSARKPLESACGGCTGTATGRGQDDRVCTGSKVVCSRASGAMRVTACRTWRPNVIRAPERGTRGSWPVHAVRPTRKFVADAVTFAVQLFPRFS